MKKVEKIIIQGEGKQILQLLTSKGLTKKATIEQYADKLGLYDTTLKTYLKNKVICNDKFKRFLEGDFGRSYEELVKSVKNQLIYYIETMRDEIHLYNEENDLFNTNELIYLCQQQGLLYHSLIAKGNKAIIKFNMGLKSGAEFLLKEVIHEAQELGYFDLWVEYTTNLAYLHHKDRNYSTSRKRLRELESLVKEGTIENKKILHRFWYIYAITLKDMGMYSSAIDKNQLAFEFADNLQDKINSLNHIAFVYRLDGKNDQAMEVYEKALKLCGTSLTLKTTVLYHRARFCYETGDMKRAREHIKTAMILISGKMNFKDKVNILEDYLLITGDCEGVWKEIIDLLMQNESSTNRESIYRCLDHLIEKLIIKNDLSLLFRLRDQLKLIIKIANTEEETLQLKSRLADMMVYLMDRGGLAC